MTFDDFWNAWPANGSKNYEEYTRKVNKKKCAEKFAGLDEQEKQVAVTDVTQRAKFDKGWRKNNGKYLCAPLVYLNNSRWEDGDFADVRNHTAKGKASSSGLDYPEVRRAIVGCIVLNYTDKAILATFSVTPQELYDLRTEQYPALPMTEWERKWYKRPVPELSDGVFPLSPRGYRQASREPGEDG